MSKWSDDFKKMHKDVRSVKEATKDVLQKGGKLACEKYHDSRSLERLKSEIRRIKK